MNVLSLFDGISCGMLALEKSGITVNNYYASEIDKQAITVSKYNYPNIIQLGDVRSINKDMLLTLPQIDLLIGGSPCQGFSMAGKQLAFDDERSALYFEYERILNELKIINPNILFLLENVKMKAEYRDIISLRLGVEPIYINSSLVSAQNRPRWYWTNIGIDPKTNISNVINPTDKGIYLEDILEQDIEDKYRIKDGRLKWLKNFGELKEKDGYVAFNPNKAKCLTVRGEPSWNTTYILQWPIGCNAGGLKALDGKVPSMTTSSWPSSKLLLDKGLVRKLTPIECERLQTVPDGYTSCLPDTHRYKVLGNGWTIDVIAHIFSYIPPL